MDPIHWFCNGKTPLPQNYIAIMDDLLVHSKEEDHMDRILDMLRALVEHGLKLSPIIVQYGGHGRGHENLVKRNYV